MCIKWTYLKQTQSNISKHTKGTVSLRKVSKLISNLNWGQVWPAESSQSPCSCFTLIHCWSIWDYVEVWGIKSSTQQINLGKWLRLSKFPQILFWGRLRTAAENYKLMQNYNLSVDTMHKLQTWVQIQGQQLEELIYLCTYNIKH